jgi:hypothetical protein
MLGRNSYTKEELDHCTSTLDQQLAAYRALVKLVPSAATDKKGNSALATFEWRFFNNMTIVLDRFFVHRVRMVAGKDGNPLNEVEMLCESLMNNNGILRESSVIKLVPARSVLKLNFGDPIRITAAEFKGLSAAFLHELELKFL